MHSLPTPAQRLSERLELQFPILQAPMAGVSTAELAGAVSHAGGLGAIAVGALSAPAADAAIGAAMRASGGRLNVNLFVHSRPRRDPAREAAWLRRLAPHFTRFGMDPPTRLEEIYPTLDDAPDLLDVISDRRPPVVSLHFGLPAAATLARLKDTGACLLATATSVTQARVLEAAGIDVIVAQGFEAGGHRGHFGPEPDACLPSTTLLPAIVAAVAVPVVAAGGLTTGADAARALEAGAAGVQLGTVFVECPESAAAAPYRQALRAPERRTVMTAVFSGRPARGLSNSFTRTFDPGPDTLPDYPVAYDAGKRLAAAAAQAGDHGYGAMWAGSGPRRPEPLPAADLVRALAAELAEAGEPRAGIR